MIQFVVFHTGAEALKTYGPLMMASQAALAKNNPKARYIVLTDEETAPSLGRYFDVRVLAPSGEPLMFQYMKAQLAYERQAEPGLVVLAATDCVANRDLSTALKHNMAVTYRHRSKPDALRLVNNVAYIEDHDRGAWFLDRALKILEQNRNKSAFGMTYDTWWGDQAAWQEALGPISSWERVGEWDMKLAKPEGRWIHLYPCRTHNYFNKFSNATSATSDEAYLLHFKGSRKKYMIPSIEQHILKHHAPKWGKK